MNHETSRGVTYLLVIVLFLFLTISYFRSNTPLISVSQDKKTYNDINLGFYFKYPQNFDVRKTDAGNIAYIDIFPKNQKDSFEPKFIEIIVIDTKSNESLGQVILDSYPELRRNDLKKLYKKDTDAYQIIGSKNINERFIISYFRHAGKLYIVKFNEKYYDSSNPFALVNNSPSQMTYFNILNSLAFTQAN